MIHYLLAKHCINGIILIRRTVTYFKFNGAVASANCKKGVNKKYWIIIKVHFANRVQYFLNLVLALMGYTSFLVIGYHITAL